MFEKLVGKPVMIQLKHQPYIGITGIPMQPLLATSPDGTSREFVSTPLIHGILREVEMPFISVETTDPDGDSPNRLLVTLNVSEIGIFTTYIEKSLIQQA